MYDFEPNYRKYLQIPGAQVQSAASPITIGTPVPTGSGTGRICGRVFSAETLQTNAIAYSIAIESVCSQRVSARCTKDQDLF